MNDAPVILSGKRVEVALAQKALATGIDELIDACRVASVLPVIDLDGAPVLHAPMYGFDFLVPPQIEGDFWRRDGQRKHNEHQQEQNGQEDKTILPPRFAHRQAISPIVKTIWKMTERVLWSLCHGCVVTA